MKPIDFGVYLISDRGVLRGKNLLSALAEALEAGIRVVQLREKDLTPLELYRLAVDVRKLCSKYDTLMLVNDRSDIAKAVGADGVHLTSTSIPPYAARRSLGEDAIIGVSTHSLEEAMRAEEGGAGFVTFSPVFPTLSKPMRGEPQGLENLRKVSRALRIPVFALGGVEPRNAADCIKHGAYGVAAIGSLLGADDIVEAVEGFKRAIGRL